MPAPEVIVSPPLAPQDLHWREELKAELAYLARWHRAEIRNAHPGSARTIASIVVRQHAVAKQLAELDAVPS